MEIEVFSKGEEGEPRFVSFDRGPCWLQQYSLCDPYQTLQPLPRRQDVAVLPNIEWKGYVESLQQVARQNSSIYLNTRRQSRPQPPDAAVEEKLVRDADGCHGDSVWV